MLSTKFILKLAVFISLVGICRAYEIEGIQFESDSKILIPAKLVLTRKCVEILGASPFVCNRVTGLAIQALDFEFDLKNSKSSDDISKTILIFSHDAREVFRDPRFVDYIERLYLRYSAFSFGLGSWPHLYETSVQVLGSDILALKWIGLLFQDNNYPYHQNWLIRNSALNSTVLNKYLFIYDQIHSRYLQQNSQGVYPDFIDQNIKDKFGSKIYYYYLNFLLFNKLQLAGANFKIARSLEAEFNRVLRAYPLFLNLLYLQHHLYHSSMAIVSKEVKSLGSFDENGKLISNGIIENEGHTLVVWRQRYRDLYMCYIAMLQERMRPYSFEQFEREMFSNPIEFLSQLSL